MRRFLLLEDGDSFEGKAFGSFMERSGELVFNTSFTGYYEIMTDPSYGGQMLVFNFPSMFYYDFRDDVPQGIRISASGIVCKGGVNPSGTAFHLIDKQMKLEGVPGIYGIDTRKLVKKIRDTGNLRAMLSNSSKMPDTWEPMDTEQLVKKFSPDQSYEVNSQSNKRILFVDMGAKVSLIKQVSHIGNLHVVNLSALPQNFDGYDMVFLSNGPGNPSDKIFDDLRQKLRRAFGSIPVSGVCLGHQIIGSSLGVKIEKMTFGHHGSNHSVGDHTHSYITSHNHNYRLEEDSLLDAQIPIIQRDLNDNTVEMISLDHNLIMSVQYHPEGAPGPVNSTGFFGKMEAMMNVIKA